jgi:hypothetical protein
MKLYGKQNATIPRDNSKVKREAKRNYSKFATEQQQKK